MGIGSQTSTQILARFGTDVVNLKPNMAVVLIGVTDIINGGISKATFISNATSMLDSCSTHNIIPVFGKATPWTDGTTEEMQAMDSWMAELEALVNSYKGSVWCDFDNAIGQFRVGGDAGNLWDINPSYDADGIHLNSAGYAAMAVVIHEAIELIYRD